MTIQDLFVMEQMSSLHLMTLRVYDQLLGRNDISNTGMVFDVMVTLGSPPRFYETAALMPVFGICTD